MKKGWRITLIVLAALLVVLCVGPFLVPVPPLEGIKSVEELADADSLFIELNGLRVHYKRMGEGEPVFILLHGFAANLFSWHKVADSFAQHGLVISYDRPAFGLTERPFEWEGQNPYAPEAQVALLIALLDALEVRQAILVGHSAGGTVALNAALAHPERVQALILVDAAVYTSGGAPEWLKPLLRTPQMRHLGHLFARLLQARGQQLIEMAWHDSSTLTAEDLAGYTEPLMIADWDRALWEMTLATYSLDPASRLDELVMPVLVITGDDDRVVPTEESIRLYEELPNAVLAVIPDCGHVPHEESPELFMQAVDSFLDSLR